MAAFIKAWQHMLDGGVAECENHVFCVEANRLNQYAVAFHDTNYIDVKFGVCEQFDSRLFFSEWKINQKETDK